MGFIVITNNPMVNNKTDGAIYDADASYMDVLESVRDKVHLGHRILTHPLAGSVKPGQTPYRSVIISAGRGEETDYDSLILIENALLKARMPIKDSIECNERLLADFQLIDYSLIADIIS